MSNPYPDYKSNVVYTLPEPTLLPFYDSRNKFYDSDQIQAAFAAGAASRDAEIEALRAALDELSHAVHEIHHARHNPNWFTNGKHAAMQHESLWIGRAAEMVKNRSAAIAAEGGRHDKV